jgi:hypothetical protein
MLLQACTPSCSHLVNYILTPSQFHKFSLFFLLIRLKFPITWGLILIQHALHAILYRRPSYSGNTINDLLLESLNGTLPRPLSRHLQGNENPSYQGSHLSPRLSQTLHNCI